MFLSKNKNKFASYLLMKIKKKKETFKLYCLS